MTSALQTIKSVALATTDLHMRRGLVVFFPHGVLGRDDVLRQLADRLLAHGWARRLRRARIGTATAWSLLDRAHPLAGLVDLFESANSNAADWSLQLDDGNIGGDGLAIELSACEPVRGMQRLSHLRIMLSQSDDPVALAGFGGWLVEELPLWWGTAGWLFDWSQGARSTACRRMAALAKRHWAVQIVDMATLQWDGLRGMPGVNWLGLVGAPFAAANGQDVDALAADAARWTGEGVYCRRGRHGIAIAAGRSPVTGDINTGEDLGACRHVAALLQPLRLAIHRPLAGPFAKPEVMAAWLARFSNPQGWLNCNIGA